MQFRRARRFRRTARRTTGRARFGASSMAFAGRREYWYHFPATAGPSGQFPLPERVLDPASNRRFCSLSLTSSRT